MCTVKGAQVEAQSEYSYTCVFEINGQTLKQKVSTDFIGNHLRLSGFFLFVNENECGLITPHSFSNHHHYGSYTRNKCYGIILRIFEM